ncbi:DNA replication complex GINS family protein [Candidatus Bathyarchaeota archaeon]|nr:DNA replication complex GINS family protein [Candidatus Bathyarchaeota archaeon]
MNYDELYKAWRQEKEEGDLKPLSKDFYSQVQLYINNLLEEINALDEKSVKWRLLNEEVNNVKKMVKDLTTIRNKKVLETTFRGAPVQSDAYTSAEEAIYTKMVPLPEEIKKLIRSVNENYVPQQKKKQKQKPKKTLVRFLQAIPPIVGMNMKTYGPFKAEDVASLPMENAEIFIKRGVAVKVETK